ncbi:MAG: 16S rRNA (guanine(527)-N(7))-methyltransferase RsmG [Bacteroidetes bacterium]|nr:MAG: 16S rRNA (guanine(527)-N(7))-methyltransferase RsmG [Bacteroidota bacterium]
MQATVDLVFSNFPDLNEEQRKQFEQLKEQYEYWNARINVISRKDFDQFYLRHVLHSLGIAKVMNFLPEASVLDIGTGGGFPGIPLAILFPETHFHLVDSIGKKIKVVREVADAIGLQNVESTHQRGEQTQGKYDFIVSRAVTAMPDFLQWTKGKFLHESRHELPNGILYLKGGDLTEEMKPVKKACRYYELSDFFQEDFFETKKVVHVKN